MVFRKKKTDKIGLVLTGGGARGGYQVGVLKAVHEILDSKAMPFDVITGISVGALNAAALGSRAKDFDHATTALEMFWRGLTTKNVFDPRVRRIFMTGLKLILSTLMPKKVACPPQSLLDNNPLKDALKNNINFDAISEAVRDGDIHAISVTASGYDSGYATTFFDTLTPDKEWHRVRREGLRQPISINEIMASSALPLLFPAKKIGNEYFGDGALRQTSPLAPAIHLGSDRLFIIGTRDNTPEPHIVTDDMGEYPSLGDLSGYALDTIFHDSLEADIERLERLNGLVSHLNQKEQKLTELRPIEAFSINPSRSLRIVARDFAPEMPRRLRWILRRRTADQAVGRIESYLLFEPGYLGALIDLGYKDAMARKDEILHFFNHD